MRWLVIVAFFVGCAESTEPSLDEASDRTPHCVALADLVCDVCDPEREQPECQPAEIADFCGGLDWYCCPIPSNRQANECRRAFERELGRGGCLSVLPEEYPVPECMRLVACGM